MLGDITKQRVHFLYEQVVALRTVADYQAGKTDITHDMRTEISDAVHRFCRVDRNG